MLGLDTDCTAEDIKRAYRRLALIFHPDKNQGNDAEEAKRRFQAVAKAKEVLLNSVGRKGPSPAPKPTTPKPTVPKPTEHKKNPETAKITRVPPPPAPTAERPGKTKFHVVWMCGACEMRDIGCATGTCASRSVPCARTTARTGCFCGHTYEKHGVSQPSGDGTNVQLRCSQFGCLCAHFTYIPVGAMCTCGHSSVEHDPSRHHPCEVSDCNCQTFHNASTCVCRHTWACHRTEIRYIAGVKKARPASANAAGRGRCAATESPQVSRASSPEEKVPQPPKPPPIWASSAANRPLRRPAAPGTGIPPPSTFPRTPTDGPGTARSGGPPSSARGQWKASPPVRRPSSAPSGGRPAADAPTSTNFQSTSVPQRTRPVAAEGTGLGVHGRTFSNRRNSTASAFREIPRSRPPSAPVHGRAKLGATVNVADNSLGKSAFGTEGPEPQRLTRPSSAPPAGRGPATTVIPPAVSSPYASVLSPKRPQVSEARQPEYRRPPACSETRTKTAGVRVEEAVPRIVSKQPVCSPGSASATARKAPLQGSIGAMLGRQQRRTTCPSLDVSGLPVTAASSSSNAPAKVETSASPVTPEGVPPAQQVDETKSSPCKTSTKAQNPPTAPDSHREAFNQISDEYRDLSTNPGTERVWEKGSACRTASKTSKISTTDSDACGVASSDGGSNSNAGPPEEPQEPDAEPDASSCDEENTTRDCEMPAPAAEQSKDVEDEWRKLREEVNANTGDPGSEDPAPDVGKSPDARLGAAPPAAQNAQDPAARFWRTASAPRRRSEPFAGNSKQTAADVAKVATAAAAAAVASDGRPWWERLHTPSRKRFSRSHTGSAVPPKRPDFRPRSASASISQPGRGWSQRHTNPARVSVSFAVRSSAVESSRSTNVGRRKSGEYGAKGIDTESDNPDSCRKTAEKISQLDDDLAQDSFIFNDDGGDGCTGFFGADSDDEGMYFEKYSLRKQKPHAEVFMALFTKLS